MDWAVFVVAGVATLAGAFGVILSSNPVHSALMLVMTLFGIAVLFVAQQAHFLAAVQVIVYAGAIVVLFLFVIMLLGVDRSEDLGVEPLRGQRLAAAVAGALGLVEVLLLARSHWATGAPSAAGPASGPGSNVEKLARSLFTRYLLAFEVTSVLLVIAVIGAVVLARRTRADDIEAVRAGTDDRPGGPAADGRPEGERPSEPRDSTAEPLQAVAGASGGAEPPRSQEGIAR